jgi:hypothetical protein
MAAKTTRAKPTVDTTPETATTTTNGHFTFTPANGTPITVDRMSVAIPPERHRWMFWKLRKLQGLEQPIFWLDQANVPEQVQEQLMLLPLDEWNRFFTEWMDDNGNGATPGE